MLAVILGPLLVVGFVFGLFEYGLRAAVVMPLQLIGGLAALVGIGLLLHAIIY